MAEQINPSKTAAGASDMQPQAPVTDPKAHVAVEASQLSPSSGTPGEGKKGHKPTWSLRGFGRRLYAFALFCVVLAGGLLAVRYLVRTVFFPQPAPAALIDFQGHLDASALRHTGVWGVESPAPRSPMGHYHGVDRWFQPDETNGCTLSGCHDPLPHTQQAKVPAFANFHTTFLQCQMCHESDAAAATTRPAAAAWVATTDGRPADVPAILQLLRYLDANRETITSDPAKVSPTVVSLLRQSIDVLGGDALLDGLLAQIETGEPGSPVWKHAMAELTAELPLHARGEYRAKLAWQTSAETWRDEYQTMRSQRKAYESAAAGSPEQKAVLAQIHRPLQKEPATCLSCHVDQPGLLDFASLGYTDSRATFLGRLEVARLMQQIRRGERFYIPKVMEAGREK
jgi:hypothetical protein